MGNDQFEGGVPSIRMRCSVRALVLMAWIPSSPIIAQTETIRIDLELRTGGAITGLVVGHNDDAVVLVHERTPYALAWDEIKTDSAYRAKFDLLILERKDSSRLTAEDHLGLGEFILLRRRSDRAQGHFRKALALDSSLGGRAHEIRSRHHSSQPETALTEDPFENRQPNDSSHDADPQIGTTGLGCLVATQLARVPPAKVRREVLEVYKEFGKGVREVFGERIVLLESDHFLIWTDWETKIRPLLLDWSEAMYTALCRQFRLDPSKRVFLAKCPVFAFRSKSRFLRFARRFDGHDAGDAVGYTRSIVESGHVHVVLLRTARSTSALNRFATTLAHEGTHAFVHRLHSTRLIPHWVNEGLAELIAERLLGDRCFTGEKASLLAEQYVKYDWPIDHLLRSVGPIEVHDYPLAHSVVGHLNRRSPEQFADFVKRMKNGENVAQALAESYDGLTWDKLDNDWRVEIRGLIVPASAAPDLNIPDSSRSVLGR